MVALAISLPEMIADLETAVARVGSSSIRCWRTPPPRRSRWSSTGNPDLRDDLRVNVTEANGYIRTADTDARRFVMSKTKLVAGIMVGAVLSAGAFVGLLSADAAPEPALTGTVTSQA